MYLSKIQLNKQFHRPHPIKNGKPYDMIGIQSLDFYHKKDKKKADLGAIWP